MLIIAFITSAPIAPEAKVINAMINLSYSANQFCKRFGVDFIVSHILLHWFLRASQSSVL